MPDLNVHDLVRDTTKCEEPREAGAESCQVAPATFICKNQDRNKRSFFLPKIQRDENPQGESCLQDGGMQREAGAESCQVAPATFICKNQDRNKRSFFLPKFQRDENPQGESCLQDGGMQREAGAESCQVAPATFIPNPRLTFSTPEFSHNKIP